MVSTANSLVGTAANDLVGTGIAALGNGHYAVLSGYWNNGATAQAGAVTWATGHAALSSDVNAANSLVGVATDDAVGYYGIRYVDSNHYVILNNAWNNGAQAQAGAITLASDAFRIAGTIQGYNSVRANAAGEGTNLVYAYDPGRQRLVVGRPDENLVSLFTMDQIFADGLDQ
jgi:hypothetical protein